MNIRKISLFSLVLALLMSSHIGSIRAGDTQAPGNWKLFCFFLGGLASGGLLAQKFNWHNARQWRDNRMQEGTFSVASLQTRYNNETQILDQVCGRCGLWVTSEVIKCPKSMSRLINHRVTLNPAILTEPTQRKVVDHFASNNPGVVTTLIPGII